ncbi:hypothetical protein [Mesorhizobium japonicum]|nr:hypothetical protein [Mesorhizobium japonicum]
MLNAFTTNSADVALFDRIDFAALRMLREQRIEVAFIGVNAVHPTDDLRGSRGRGPRKPRAGQFYTVKIRHDPANGAARQKL